MDYLKQLKIHFAGLSTGKHLYFFNIGKEFLAEFDFQGIDDISAEVAFSLQKDSESLHLNFDIKGAVKTLCDRCGDELNLPFESKEELIIKFGSEPGEESEKVIVIHTNETEIDISQYIYEFITFAFPLKKLHSEGMCNKESLKKLNQFLLKSEKKGKIDPRWQDLLKVKLS